MDVSGETADLLIKEGVQAAEGAIKLAGVGLKNVAALLIVISQQNYKVVGKTTSKRLARDPAPAEVVHLKKEDMPFARVWTSRTLSAPMVCGSKPIILKWAANLAVSCSSRTIPAMSVMK